MAVIREKRQFALGKIGVARASNAGQIVGEQISRSANQMADIFYREAAQEAEKTGIETGSSVEREKILTINPQTGEPEAYAVPEGFGKIAAESYQRIVLRRFQQSIDDEMQLKAKELAVRFEDSPNAAGLYESAMSDYIASMSNAAQGQFKTYIQDVGTTYLNATRTNLAIAQVRRERAAAKKAQAESVATAHNNIEAMVAQYGPEQLNGPTQTQAVIASASQSVTDGGNAKLFDPATVNNMNTKTRVAVARGLIRYAAGQSNDPESLTMLQHAIGTQNPNLVPKEFSYVAEALSGFGGDYRTLASLEKFSDGLLSDQVQYAKVVEAQEQERQEAEVAARIRSIGAEIPLVSASTQATILDAKSNVIASGGSLSRAYFQETAAANAEPSDDLREALIEQRDAKFSAGVEAIQIRTLRGLNKQELVELTAAIDERDVTLAPESARPGLTALMRLNDKVDPTILSGLRTAAGKDNRGKLQTQIDAAAASEQAMSLDIESIGATADIEAATNSVLGELGKIKNLDDGLSKGLRKTIGTRASTSFIGRFFGTNPTEAQISEAKQLLEGGDADLSVLTAGQADAIRSAASYANGVENISAARTSFNTQASTVRDRIRRTEEQAQRSEALFKIKNGAGSPKNKEDRELIEEDLERRYAEELGGRSLAQVWADPSSLADENILPILGEIADAHVMPESLNDALSALASGSFRGQIPTALISHYRNFRDYNVGTTVVGNPMMDALSMSERTVLDYLADAAPIMGSDAPERIAQMFSVADQYHEDPMMQAKIKSFFGDQSIEDVIVNLDGFEDVPPAAYNGLKAAALSLYAVSRAEGLSSGQVVKRLEKQIDRTYPDGEGVVFSPSGTTRTRHALSKTVAGNESIFIDRVSELVAQTNPGIGEFYVGDIRSDMRAAGFETEGYIKTIYLQPIREQANGEVYYVVKQRRALEDGGDFVLTRPIRYEGEEVLAPLYVSTQDPVFLMKLNMKNAEKVLKGLSDKDERMLLNTQGMMEIGGEMP